MHCTGLTAGRGCLSPDSGVVHTCNDKLVKGSVHAQLSERDGREARRETIPCQPGRFTKTVRQKRDNWKGNETDFT